MINEMVFKHSPTFLYFQIDAGINVKWDSQLTMNDTVYRLCGMIYFADFHFTTRLITDIGDIWYQDSLHSPQSSIYKGNIESISGKTLNKAKEKVLSVVIYVTL